MRRTDTTSESVSEPRIGRSVSLDHAAQLLGVSRRTIYNRIRDGRLQTIRTLGGSQRVLLDSVHVVRSQAADGTARSSY
jgi:excisionase family DNA binding protein